MRARPSPLDADIAAALADENADSAALLKLIREARCGRCRRRGRREGARAGPGSACLDPDKAQTTGAKDRVRPRPNRRCVAAALGALQEAHAHERSARWDTECGRVISCGVCLLRSCPQRTRRSERLVDLFARIAEFDKEVDRLNGSAPAGESRRLRGVELTARDLNDITNLNPPIAQSCCSCRIQAKRHVSFSRRRRSISG